MFYITDEKKLFTLTKLDIDVSDVPEGVNLSEFFSDYADGMQLSNGLLKMSRMGWDWLEGVVAMADNMTTFFAIYDGGAYRVDLNQQFLKM